MFIKCLVFCALLVLVISEDVTLEDHEQKAIDPIVDQDLREREHSKRTIFQHGNPGWAKHVKFRGGRPLVLGYSPLGLKYLPVGKPILLKPVHNGFRFKPRPQWKPKRIVPLIPSKPLLQNDGWRPIVPVHVPAPPHIEPKPWQEQGWGNAKPVLQVQGSSKPTIVHHVDHHVHVDQAKPVAVSPAHHVHVEQPKPVLVAPVNHVHYEPAKPVHVDPIILKPVQVYYPKPVYTDHVHQHVQHGSHVDDVIKPVLTDHVHQHVQHGNHVDDVIKPVLYPQQPQVVYYNPLAVPKPQLPVLPLGSAFPSPVLVPQPQVTHLHPVPNPVDAHPVVPDVHQHVHHPVVPEIHQQVPHHHVIQQYPHVHQVVPQVPQVQPVVPQIHQQVPHIHQQVPHVHQQVPQIHPQVPHVHQQVPHFIPQVQPQQYPQEIPLGQVPQQQVPNVAPTYPNYLGFPQQSLPNPTVQNPQHHPAFQGTAAQPEVTPTPSAPNYQNQLVIEYHGNKAHLIQPYNNQYIPENYNPDILPGSDGRPTQDLSNFYRQQQQQEVQQQYEQSIHDQTAGYYTQGRYEVAEQEPEEGQGIQPGQTDLQLPAYLPQHPNYRPDYREPAGYEGAGYQSGYATGYQDIDRSAQESEEDLK